MHPLGMGESLPLIFEFVCVVCNATHVYLFGITVAQTHHLFSNFTGNIVASPVMTQNKHKMDPVTLVEGVDDPFRDNLDAIYLQLEAMRAELNARITQHTWTAFANTDPNIYSMKIGLPVLAEQPDHPGMQFFQRLPTQLPHVNPCPMLLLKLPVFELRDNVDVLCHIPGINTEFWDAFHPQPLQNNHFDKLLLSQKDCLFYYQFRSGSKRCQWTGGEVVARLTHTVGSGFSVLKNWEPIAAVQPTTVTPTTVEVSCRLFAKPYVTRELSAHEESYVLK